VPCQPRTWRQSLTDQDPAAPPIPDLLHRDFTASAPGEKMAQYPTRKHAINDVARGHSDRHPPAAGPTTAARGRRDRHDRDGIPMKTLVITGGTDGMGKALARTYLDRGDTVIVCGRDRAKAASLPDAYFIPAELSLISENRRVIQEINTKLPVVDALVLCARYFRSRRFQTVEGIEGTFALDYLSRFLPSHGISEPRLIVNVSGPGGPPGLIQWHDPMLAHDYHGVTAPMQAGRANDLLGLSYARLHSDSKTRYVLINPGGVATSFAGDYDPTTAAHVEALRSTASQ
jgi:NAD(P)-dependent dehydrogenase (short-subunit alcohol dehydrogenase family)